MRDSTPGSGGNILHVRRIDVRQSRVAPTCYAAESDACRSRKESKSTLELSAGNLSARPKAARYERRREKIGKRQQVASPGWHRESRASGIAIGQTKRGIVDEPSPLSSWQ